VDDERCEFHTQTSNFTGNHITGEGQSMQNHTSGLSLVISRWVPENYISALFNVSDVTTYNFDYNIISVLGGGFLTNGVTTINLGSTDKTGSLSPGTWGFKYGIAQSEILHR
jgi:hypothetical protein